MSEVTLTMPDGAKRRIAKGTTGLDVAKAISPSLAKRTVAMTLDGVLTRSCRSDRRRCRDQVRVAHRSRGARAHPA